MEKQSTATAQEEKAEQMEKIMALPRNARRASLRIRHGANARPFSRQRSGAATGTTPHFRLWMADLAKLSALQRLSTDTLADALSNRDSKTASAFALLWLGGYRNVWDLSRANVESLLRVKGIGPAKLEAVEAHLKDRNVSLAWTAA